MSFQDKTLTCADCGESFTFTADEQEFFQSKGYTNEPKRCLSCRRNRRGGMRNEDGGYSSRPPRQMFAVVCARCGVDTEVPFEPRDGRPVYCSECYSKERMSG